MADIAVTARLVGPLPGAIVREFNAGGAVNVGDLVYIATDGDVEAADGSVAGTARARGICVSAGTEGAEAAAAGDRVAVVTHGPVTGFSGMTPGAIGYVSDTTGKIADAAGTVSQICGYAERADVFYFAYTAA